MTLSLRLLMGLFLAVILAIEVTWLDRKAFGPRALRKGPHYTLSLPPSYSYIGQLSCWGPWF